MDPLGGWVNGTHPTGRSQQNLEETQAWIAETG